MSNFTTIALQDDVMHEGKRILSFWKERVLLSDGSFYGEIGSDGIPNSHAPRSFILASRILWTFSRAWNSEFTIKKEDKLTADQSYEFLKKHFWDEEHLGFFWMIDEFHKPINDAKHIYAQAFAIYALAEYFEVSKNYEAILFAQLTFSLIERHAADDKYGGYLESFTRDWTTSHNALLDPEHLNSDTDLGKSMNTHLHLLEAYTQLYRIWPNERLKRSIQKLLDLLEEKILNQVTHHFALFFDFDWTVKSNITSYGHDIEGSWLMLEAAQMIHDYERIHKFQKIALDMVDAVLQQGMDNDYGLFNEGRGNDIIDDNKDWWPQAEAVVGCINAYQISGDRVYLEAAQNIWGFITRFLIDVNHGDWYWRVFKNGDPDPQKPIVEPWKCPYHNTRACIEVWQRLMTLEE